MILIDTSIWIDHFRRPELQLAKLVVEQGALMHPLVFGELCMGDLRPRAMTIASLLRLPFAQAARDVDVLALVESEELFASGLSFIDAHLLTTAVLDRRLRLWTRDKRLTSVSAALGVALETGA